jgi:flagellar biogenesis protein FliO
VTSDAAGTVAAQSSSPGAGFQLLTPGRIFVVLLLAGGIGFAVYLRKQSPTATAGPAPMHVIGHLSIAQDQRLTLVRCQDDVLLLGVSPNNITLLQTYSEASFASAAAPPIADGAAPDASAAASGTALSGFADVLRQYTNHGRHA